MAKKHREPIAPAPAEKGISKKGWKIIGGGLSLLVAGFTALCFTDPRGQNWASTVSPFLILGGYAVVGLGIMTPDPEENDRRQSTEAG
jgi:hypothetical protein